MRYLFFISQNYSFEILRPLQAQARQRGAIVKWFVYLDRVNTKLFNSGEDFTCDVDEAVTFAPDAVFVPGNIVPKFIPGLKVEVFHGFEWKKKGHFRIRGCFDLYCTQGPFFTERFEQLAKQHKFFDVVETGWTKLDPLFSARPLDINPSDNPCILYAPTFSPSLTSAAALKREIERLSQQRDWLWLIKFHPKMPPEVVEQFKAMQHDKLHVVEMSEISRLLQTADVIVSDTSSIITEFLLLNKPAVTFNNAAPEPVLINITQPQRLNDAIEQALNPDQERQQRIEDYNRKIHPYQDGRSAERVLNAVEHRVQHGKHAPKPLPLNLIRNLKMRKQLGYWKI